MATITADPAVATVAGLSGTQKQQIGDRKQAGDRKAETLKAEMETMREQVKAAKEAVHAQVWRF